MIHPKAGETLPEPLADLQSAYPGWSIWTSRGDCGFVSRCYATRLGELTRDQTDRGLAMTVHAETPDVLGRLLAKQAEISQDLTERGLA
ncbi:hypothetical protein ACQEVF_25100 [Nonomuraea polychroma]|uniref:hypothetical protein n=1 Tax=Nonomuraea polychroma TaxID=46176 RepID=UPI003D8FDB79